MQVAGLDIGTDLWVQFGKTPINFIVRLRLFHLWRCKREMYNNTASAALLASSGTCSLQPSASRTLCCVAAVLRNLAPHVTKQILTKWQHQHGNKATQCWHCHPLPSCSKAWPTASPPGPCVVSHRAPRYRLVNLTKWLDGSVAQVGCIATSQLPYCIHNTSGRLKIISSVMYSSTWHFDIRSVLVFL